jgi:hypothetical protein
MSFYNTPPSPLRFQASAGCSWKHPVDVFHAGMGCLPHNRQLHAVAKYPEHKPPGFSVDVLPKEISDALIKEEKKKSKSKKK